MTSPSMTGARATTADPAVALAYFLQAQAKFAVGHYVDAVNSIREGLARDPNWPKSAFNPAEFGPGSSPSARVLHRADAGDRGREVGAARDPRGIPG